MSSLSTAVRGIRASGLAGQPRTGETRMRYEVFHRGLLGRNDVIAVDMLHYPGAWGPCFSHHAPNNNHPRYAADTTTDGVMRFLADAAAGRDGPSMAAWSGFTVTTNHVDADSMLPVWALLNPQAALERRSQIERVARSGDFFLYLDDPAAKANFVIEELPVRLRGDRPWGGRSTIRAVTRQCFDQLLPCIGDLLDGPDRWSHFWETPMRAMSANLVYLSGHGRVSELWDRHTSFVESDRALDPHSLNTVCRNDILVTWRTDCAERHIDARPGIAWYDLKSIPNRPLYDLPQLGDRLNAAEPGEDPVWSYLPGPMSLSTASSGLSQDRLLTVIGEWLRQSPPSDVSASYRADVRKSAQSSGRHLLFDTHSRFVLAESVCYRPGEGYGGLFPIVPQGPSVRSTGSASKSEGLLSLDPGKTPVPFAVADDFYWNKAEPDPLELAVTYEDCGAGCFHVEYDAWDEPCRATPAVVTLGQGGERHAVFPLEDARLAASLEDGADLRIARRPGTPLAIRELTLRKLNRAF